MDTAGLKELGKCICQQVIGMNLESGRRGRCPGEPDVLV